MYRTFELLPQYIHGNSINSLLLAVYRPGSNAPTTEFVDEFTDVLDRSLSYSKCVVVGDVNIHLDDPVAPQPTSFLNVLNNFGLSEWVRQPTHRRGFYSSQPAHLRCSSRSTVAHLRSLSSLPRSLFLLNSSPLVVHWFSAVDENV